LGTDNSEFGSMRRPEKLKFRSLPTIIIMNNVTTEKFWSLIDDAVRVSRGVDALKESFLVVELKKLSLSEIIDFEIVFRKLVIDADTYKVMAALKIIEGFVSDDSYLYFRCWLIGQGKATYTETLRNPDYLASIVPIGELCFWEGLMYVATIAYSNKTGKEEDENFPREIALGLDLDYDNGAPPTKGTDWKEDQLPNILPKLWAKFS
jgi:hypothetical protein